MSTSAIETKALGVWFGRNHAVRDVSLEIPAKQITAIIGPSGCGKSTLLRCFNRMNDLIPTARVEGVVLLNGENIYQFDVDPAQVRRRVGMVFQKPNPFPKSVFENVAFGPKLNGVSSDSELASVVRKSLEEAALWDEVKDRLDDSAIGLSGGQQQRLCIARALAVDPKVILMDEPCSALDPQATAKIEQLMRSLAKDYTVVVVTHNMQQAARVSNFTAFMYLGELIEYGLTDDIFENPKNELTENYITGRFG
jgi:phosphate transport system ATP-binding protein